MDVAGRLGPAAGEEVDEGVTDAASTEVNITPFIR